MWLKTQINELRVLGVVIMLFCLDARIGKMVDFDVHPQFFPDCFHHLRQFENRELLRELVVHSALAARGRILAGNLDAANRVSNVEKTTHLSALAVHGEWLANGRLHAEAVEHGAEHVILIEPIDEGFVESNFVGHRPVHDALIQIRGANSPDFAREHDVMAVVNL